MTGDSELNASQEPLASTGGETTGEAQRWWVAPLVTIATVAVVVVGSLYIYHQIFASKPMKFAVLDLHYIIDAKEVEFTAILASPSVTDDERKKAMDLVSGIEPQLKDVLSQVRAECGCEILVKAAALSSTSLPDITKRVGELMGINPENVAQAKEQIRRNINGNLPK
jgi:hypothetical protein